MHITTKSHKCILLLLIVFSIFCRVVIVADDSQQPEKISLTGTILKVSEIPDAAKSDYPDCYYSALMKIGKDQTAKNVVILIKCFENKKDLPQNKVKQGDQIAVSCIAFDDALEKTRQIQQSDQIEQFDLNYYFVEGNVKVGNSSMVQSDKKIQSVSKKEFVTPPPISEIIQHQIHDYIKKELSIVSKRLKMRKNDTPVMYTAEAAERLARFQKNKDEKELLYWKNEHLIRIFSKKILSEGCINQEAVSVLTNFDRELKKRNIRFIFVSFPNPEEYNLPFFSSNISKENAYDATRLKNVEALLKNDIEAIDLGHYFYEQNKIVPYFTDIIANDPHPMDYAIDLLADILKERLNGYDLKAYQYQENCFKKVQKVFFRKNIYPAGNQKYTGLQKIDDYIFTCPKERPLIKSPVFVMGDSFSITPWRSSGIRGALGAKLRIIIDGYQNQSGCGRIARTISARDYLPISGKQVVIMLVTGDCFCKKWEPLLKKDTERQGNISEQKIVINAENIPETWKSCRSQNQRMILNLAKKEEQYSSEMLEVQIPENLFSVEGIISATLFSSRSFIKVYDSNFKLIGSSLYTDFSNDKDNISLPFSSTTTRLSDKQKHVIYLQFVSKVEKNSMEIENISFLFFENKMFLRGPGKKILTESDLIGSQKKSLGTNEIRFSGKRCEITSNQSVVVHPDRKVSSSIKITNSGTAETRILYGLSVFDKNNEKIDNKNFPLANDGHVVTVLATDSDHGKIVINHFPKIWRKNCSLVCVPSNEQIPFSLNGEIIGNIDNIEKNNDNHCVISLDKPIKKEVPIGCKIQINGIAGANLYFQSKVLRPHETAVFSFEVIKDEKFSLFSSKALMKDIFFVKPLVLSFSTNIEEENTIDISEFKMTY